jgi:hypothetical protein
MHPISSGILRYLRSVSPSTLTTSCTMLARIWSLDRFLPSVLRPQTFLSQCALQLFLLIALLSQTFLSRWRRRGRDPLVLARILHPGTHYLGKEAEDLTSSGPCRAKSQDPS